MIVNGEQYTFTEPLYYIKIKNKDMTERVIQQTVIHLIKSSEIVSFWNEIPLKNEDETFNVVIEIPLLTVKKYEIDTKSTIIDKSQNPEKEEEKKHFIKQDINKPKDVNVVVDNVQDILREYPIPMLWNYGAFPQTWEDDQHLDPHTNIKGDGDPLDLIEISGNKDNVPGTIIQVIPLGVLGMIDKGDEGDETDWKVICIQKGEKYEQIKTCTCLAEINDKLGGEIDLIKLWLTYYKVLEAYKKSNPIMVDDLKKMLENPSLSNKFKITTITSFINSIDQHNDCFYKKIEFYGIDIDPYSGYYFYDTDFKLSFSNLNPFHHKSPFNNAQLAIKIIDENYQHWVKRPKK